MIERNRDMPRANPTSSRMPKNTPQDAASYSFGKNGKQAPKANKTF
jgi:hypothetical protein